MKEFHFGNISIIIFQLLSDLYSRLITWSLSEICDKYLFGSFK